MSLAGWDLLLGARVPCLVAALLAGCSGVDDDASVSGPIGTSSFEGGLDAPVDNNLADVSRHDDARSSPPDGARSQAARDAGSSAIDVILDGPEPALCLRLDDPQDKNRVLVYSQAVGDQFLLFIQGDCRVGNALRPPGGTPALAAWRNDLYAWNLDLWGCTERAASGFTLLSSAFAGWSQPDAQVLIEEYLRAATKILSLTDGEAADLRGQLQRLATPPITSEAGDSNLSTCPVDASSEADAPPDSQPADAAPSDADAAPGDADAAPSDADAAPSDADAALEEGGD